MDDNPTTELRTALIQASKRARQPQLPLRDFLTDPGDDPDDESPISDPSESESAHARRGALLVAAEMIIDRCISDLQNIAFSDDGSVNLDQAQDSFVFQNFPTRHRRSYTEKFFRKVLVCSIKVTQDLVSATCAPPACTTEEIIRRSIAEHAVALCQEAGLGAPWLHPSETLLEDFDFEALYEDYLDGLEDDPVGQAAAGLVVLGVDDWFTPFDDQRQVHPYAESEPSERAELHDLRRRLNGLSEDAQVILQRRVIDSPAPIATLAPLSDIIALARHTANRDHPEHWVADESHPDASFSALIRIASQSPQGSGWIIWEPYENADLVREDPVFIFEPHRHFPLGRDEPYADASLGDRIISIPLRAVVSYRPDADVQQRFNIFFPEGRR